MFVHNIIRLTHMSQIDAEYNIGTLVFLHIPVVLWNYILNL